MPGTGELILILIIVLVVFGAGNLPRLGEAIGRSFRSLKRTPGAEPGPATPAPPSGPPAAEPPAAPPPSSDGQQS